MTVARAEPDVLRDGTRTDERRNPAASTPPGSHRMARAVVRVIMEGANVEWPQNPTTSPPLSCRYDAPVTQITMAPTTDWHDTSLRLNATLLAHVDQQRQLEGLSRAGYIRKLIADDIRRQGPADRTSCA